MDEKYYKKYLKYKQKYALLKNSIYSQYGGNPLTGGPAVVQAPPPKLSASVSPTEALRAKGPAPPPPAPKNV